MKEKLTANDKAATFVGWEPVKFDYIHGFVRGKDKMRSPDMTRPENYMRALEAINKRTHHGPIVLLIRNGKWCVELYKVLSDEFCVSLMEPVEALATLYDKENPNG